MTTGLPGTGIGGLFYLLSAMLMPVWEMRRALRRRHREAAAHGARWALVLRQFALALGILAGLAATGWVLGRMIPPDVMATSAGRLAAGVEPVRAIGAAVIIITLCTLAAVLISIEALRLFVNWRRPLPVLAPAPRSQPPGRVIPSAVHRVKRMIRRDGGRGARDKGVGARRY